MNTALHYYRAGMGATPPGQTAATAGAGYASAAAQIIHGDYVSGVGTALLSTGLLVPYPANLFLYAAGALADLLGAIGIGKGCGQTCITASNYANQAENILRQNLNTYLALPAPRAQSAQQAALNIFDQAWQGLVSVCSNPALNDAGKNCISQRQQGACAFKTSPGAGCAPNQSWCWIKDSSGNCHYQGGGPAGSGSACWNWWGYRDPIAQDPCVVPDATAATSSITSAISSMFSSNNMLPLLLIGGGVLLVMGMSSS